MTTSMCQRCGESVFWFARHSVWLHGESHSRFCAPVGSGLQAAVSPHGSTSLR
ncbi:MAG: hypothetical protein JWO77_1646 [Ilumatobacteraceae bacterium]|nr:hypothetical protein [Ilumatobacteraceae bacterium]